MFDDTLAKRLTQFTPDGTGLDRDALLFAAGRASVRPSRLWLTLAATLAISQMATLGVVLWPAHAPEIQVPINTGPRDVAVESAPPSAPDASTTWALRERIIAAEGNLPPPVPIDMGPSAEPLHAFGAVPLDLLN
jgi:hypothetical protein